MLSIIHCPNAHTRARQRKSLVILSAILVSSLRTDSDNITMFGNFQYNGQFGTQTHRVFIYLPTPEHTHAGKHDYTKHKIMTFNNNVTCSLGERFI